MEAIGIGVAVTVISAAILAALRWLWVHREALWQGFKERTCQHRWEPINRPGDDVVLVSGYTEWCAKCGAQR